MKLSKTNYERQCCTWCGNTAEKGKKRGAGSLENKSKGEKQREPIVENSLLNPEFR